MSEKERKRYFSYRKSSNSWRNNTLKMILDYVPKENRYVEYWNDCEELGRLIMEIENGHIVILSSILNLITPLLDDMISTLRFFERHNIEIYSDDEPDINVKGCCQLFSILEEFIDFEDLD